MQILIPIDGSGCSIRATHFVAKQFAKIPALEVHLLNVQPLGDDWMIRRMIRDIELTTLERDWGNSAIEPANAVLQSAGITAHNHVVQGDVAATIVQQAEELGCDQIVMGCHGRTGLTGLMMGSIASKVMHLAKLPITFIK